MRRLGVWFAPALATAMLSTSAASEGPNETRRVAAIDPDAELARALNIALSPWGTTVTKVQIDVTAPIVDERARAIAQQTHADVVMWVSEHHGHYAVWIYDVASDHTSLRDLTTSPPFDATTAASVALSVKALLRLTVVAPPRERFGAAQPPPEPDWTFGLSTSLADHAGSASLLEPRGALYASYWPRIFGHYVGAEIGLSTGLGVSVNQKTPTGTVFNGTLADFGGRAAIGARTPLASWLGVELSLGATVHLVSLKADVTSGGVTRKYPAVTRVDGGFEPQVAFTVAILHDVLRVAPWAGVTVLTVWQRFLVEKQVQLEVSPLTIEGGIRAEVMAP
jgi:hypothetical protein